MAKITVNTSSAVKKMKPMHGGGQPPVVSSAKGTHFHYLTEAGIPYSRLHDVGGSFGGGKYVDVPNIFRSFDADENDPASYDFTFTDHLLGLLVEAGVEPYYRLGITIENAVKVKPYFVFPPKDYEKWARICEHIIRHYTEGWGNGYLMDIEYWEIWNEPDLDPDDSDHKRCWGGTAKQFYELFCITYKHLKACFPHLKIGGPACAGLKEDWIDGLFEAMKEYGIEPDFFSWHVYGATIEKVQRQIRFARALLDKHGFTKTESILNEWNYVRDWVGDDWIYSRKMEKSLKGASFIAATMCMSQYEALDNLMFYDARPCGMNSMFCTDFVFECLKGYYPFYMFNQLYRQEAAVAVERNSEDVWAAAAKGEERNVILAYYNDDDNAPEKTVKVELKNVENANGVRLEYYLLDADHNCELVREEIFTATDFAAYVKMPLDSTYLLKIVKI